MTAPTTRTLRRTCTECGTEHESTVRHADFCSPLCRKAFNNRRAVRGAKLYDLLMALRHERGLARTLKVWSFICRLASTYREEDCRERAGRHSWRSPRQVLARHSHLNAIVISSTTWRKAA